MLKRIVCLVLVVLVASTLAPGTARAEVTTESAKYAATVLTKVNELRAGLGLNPVVRYQELDVVAQDWSQQQASQTTMQHRPNFADAYPAGWTAASENVAMRSDGGDVGALIFGQWLNSPGHYQNMVAPEANSLGIGFAEGADGWYATQNFATYPDAVAAGLTPTEQTSPAPNEVDPPPADSPAPEPSPEPTPTPSDIPSSQPPSAAPQPQPSAPEPTAQAPTTPTTRPTPTATRPTPRQETSAPLSAAQPTISATSSATPPPSASASPAVSRSASASVSASFSAAPLVTASMLDEPPPPGRALAVTGVLGSLGVIAASAAAIVAFMRLRRPLPRRAKGIIG